MFLRCASFLVVHCMRFQRDLEAYLVDSIPTLLQDSATLLQYYFYTIFKSHDSITLQDESPSALHHCGHHQVDGHLGSRGKADETELPLLGLVSPGGRSLGPSRTPRFQLAVGFPRRRQRGRGVRGPADDVAAARSIDTSAFLGTATSTASSLTPAPPLESTQEDGPGHRSHLHTAQTPPAHRARESRVNGVASRPLRRPRHGSPERRPDEGDDLHAPPTEGVPRMAQCAGIPAGTSARSDARSHRRDGSADSSERYATPPHYPSPMHAAAASLTTGNAEDYGGGADANTTVASPQAIASNASAHAHSTTNLVSPGAAAAAAHDGTYYGSSASVHGAQSGAGYSEPDRGTASHRLARDIADGCSSTMAAATSSSASSAAAAALGVTQQGCVRPWSPRTIAVAATVFALLLLLGTLFASYSASSPGTGLAARVWARSEAGAKWVRSTVTPGAWEAQQAHRGKLREALAFPRVASSAHNDAVAATHVANHGDVRRDSTTSLDKQLGLPSCGPTDPSSPVVRAGGAALGWLSAAMYIYSRFPQITHNEEMRKAGHSLRGLSQAMFVLYLAGNLAYGTELLYLKRSAAAGGPSPRLGRIVPLSMSPAPSSRLHTTSQRRRSSCEARSWTRASTLVRSPSLWARWVR